MFISKLHLIFGFIHIWKRAKHTGAHIHAWIHLSLVLRDSQEISLTAASMDETVCVRSTSINKDKEEEQENGNGVAEPMAAEKE